MKNGVDSLPDSTIYLSVYLSIYLPIYLSIYLSIYVSIYLVIWGSKMIESLVFTLSPNCTKCQMSRVHFSMNNEDFLHVSSFDLYFQKIVSNQSLSRPHEGWSRPLKVWHLPRPWLRFNTSVLGLIFNE